MSQVMREISRVLFDPLEKSIVGKGHCYLILDCGHWYHWTGEKAPKEGGEFPCPDCQPPITIVELSESKPTPEAKAALPTHGGPTSEKETKKETSA